jgi:DNA-binding MarR family transcriptional regulator
MPESTQTQKEVSELTTRVANIEHMVRFSLASNSEAKQFAKSHFKEKKKSAQLYLALEEPKSQVQLQSILGLSAAQVSKLCTHLEEQGFISHERSSTNRKELIFHWNDVERSLRLSKIARDFISGSKK